MRELKFRVFDLDSEKWVFPVIDITTNFSIDQTKNYSWQQYTGLKDKNGKEIYEGDIVSFGTQENHIITYEENRRVSYGHGDSGETFYIGFYIGSSYGQNNKVEVIGNIHENKDLI